MQPQQDRPLPRDTEQALAGHTSVQTSVAAKRPWRSATTRSSRAPFTLAEKLLIAVIPLGMLHHLDHVLRADNSGWPFQPHVTPFTFTLLVYVLDVTVLLARSKPWYRVGVVGMDLALVLLTHIFIEPPSHIYATWAYNASPAPHAAGEPNLLNVQSPALGVAALVLVAALLVGLLATWIAFIREARQHSANHTLSVE